MRIRKDRAHGLEARYDARHDAHHNAPYDGRAASGAAAAPSMRDVELGQIFRNMRVSMKASREMVARRLAIAVATIDSLESGAVAAFPHWRETERIVRTYCELLRLDPEPILWRIRGGLNAPAGVARPGPVASPYPAKVPDSASCGSGAAGTSGTSGVAERSAADSRSPWHGRWGRVLLALGAPLVLVAVMIVATHLAAAPLYRGIALLPKQLRAPLREGLDQLMLLTAPRREGLLWVDVGDPRARKTDRLQPGSR
jgi:Helix-turn-helix domain